MVGIQGLNSFPGHRLEFFQNLKTRTLSKLSSGRRITRASDDAAGLAIASRMASFEVSAAMGIRNLNDGISITKVADGALGSSSDTLARMRELAVQAQNGTLSDSDRATIQQEYDSLAAEISRVAESTSFNGKNLLNGDISGPDAISLEDGMGSRGLEISIDDMSAGSLGVAGLDVGAASTIGSLDAAIDKISQTRARVGATQNRIEHTVRNIQVAFESTASAKSRIMDADIAEEISNLARSFILEKGQISLRAQAMNLSSRAYLNLLG